MASDLGKDAACCRKGDSWDGEPAGRVVKFGDLNTYLAEPPQPSSRAVLLVADVYGWDAKNARLFADAVARAGFLCALPDFFHGAKLPEKPTGESFGEFIARNPFEPAGRTAAEIDAVIAELRGKHGAKAMGGQGFCWGGYHLIHTAQHADKVDAVIIAHGSRMDLPMIKTIQKPALFVCPEHDSQMDAKFRGEVAEAMAQKSFPTRVDMYKGMGHGFTTRPHFTGNAAEDEALKAASEDALQKSIAWFNEHLKA